jgi:hypothetical protein
MPLAAPAQVSPAPYAVRLPQTSSHLPHISALGQQIRLHPGHIRAHQPHLPLHPNSPRMNHPALPAIASASDASAPPVTSTRKPTDSRRVSSRKLPAYRPSQPPPIESTPKSMTPTKKRAKSTIPAGFHPSDRKRAPRLPGAFCPSAATIPAATTTKVSRSQHASASPLRHSRRTGPGPVITTVVWLSRATLGASLAARSTARALLADAHSRIHSPRWNRAPLTEWLPFSSREAFAVEQPATDAQVTARAAPRFLACGETLPATLRLVGQYREAHACLSSRSTDLVSLSGNHLLVGW